MPELPEVELIRRKLLPLLDMRFTGFHSSWPKQVHTIAPTVAIEEDIPGRRLQAIERQGKMLFLKLSAPSGRDDKTERMITIHLRMSGLLAWSTKDELSWLSHVRHRFFFENDIDLAFRDPRKFATVTYGTPKQIGELPYVRTMGPDALDLPVDRFIERMSHLGGRIKTVLLRQDIIAGIGNIIADESLHRTGLHPEQKVEDLDPVQLADLSRSVSEVIAESIAAQGSSLKDFRHPDGIYGSFQEQHRVYGQVDLPCPTCSTSIKRCVVGGRSTFFCPSCQILTPPHRE